MKLVDDPYTASEGEHWAHLSENRGRIAFATSSVPYFKPGADYHIYYSGTDALWVSNGNRLVRIELNSGPQH